MTQASIFAPSDDLLADNGYPSEDELRTVREWPIDDESDCARLLAYVEARWWAPEWGWRRAARRRREYRGGPLEWRYSISTGGWSGNEDLIDALRSNGLWWMLCWVSHRRGGHFEFRLRQSEKVTP